MIDRRSFVIGALAALGCGAPARPRIPRPPPARVGRVVVVGAGLSGLVIASALLKRGIEVLVIEATPRAGGRIRTVRGFPEGLFVEAGAMHIVPDPELLAVIDESGVAASPRPPPRPPLARVLYHRGMRRVYRPDETPPDTDQLSAEEQKLDGPARIARYFPMIDRIDPKSFDLAGEFAELDRVTCAEWMRARGASPGMIASLGDLVTGDGPASASALEVARTIAQIRRERTLTVPAGRNVGGGRIAGGTEALPQAFANRLGARIAYGTELVRLEHGPTGATLVVVDRSGRHRIEAARVVLTMPFTVLRRIDVAPAWSPLKARAVAELGMTSVTRIWVAADRRYWRDRGEAGRADTDLASGVIRDETEAQPGTAGVLGCYVQGAAGRTLGALAPAARVEAFAADIERVHPGLAGHLVHGDSVAWDDEPFARGAYATYTPGQLTTLAVAAAAPEGVVHFAGCGTSYRPGFLHGAVSSANRVVAELLDGKTRYRCDTLRCTRSY